MSRQTWFGRTGWAAVAVVLALAGERLWAGYVLEDVSVTVSGPKERLLVRVLQDLPPVTLTFSASGTYTVSGEQGDEEQPLEVEELYRWSVSGGRAVGSTTGPSVAVETEEGNDGPVVAAVVYKVASNYEYVSGEDSDMAAAYVPEWDPHTPIDFETPEIRGVSPGDVLVRDQLVGVSVVPLDQDRRTVGSERKGQGGGFLESDMTWTVPGEFLDGRNYGESAQWFPREAALSTGVSVSVTDQSQTVPPGETGNRWDGGAGAGVDRLTIIAADVISAGVGGYIAYEPEEPAAIRFRLAPTGVSGVCNLGVYSGEELVAALASDETLAGAEDAPYGRFWDGMDARQTPPAPAAPGAYTLKLSWAVTGPNNTATATAEGTITVLEARFIPDPETHRNDDAVLILPGDTENAATTINPEAGWGMVWYKVADPGVALLRANGEYVTETAATAATETLTLLGKGNGATELVAHLGSACGPVCGRIPVRVGGQITVEYDHAPTFAVEPGELPPSDPPVVVTTALTGTGWAGYQPADTGGDIDLGGQPGTPEARGPIALPILVAARATPCLVATMRITVLDADGQPKRGKEAVLVFANSGDRVLLASSLTTVSKTSDEGRVEGTLEAAFSVSAEEQALGVLRENIAILLGRAARNHVGGDPEVDAIRDSQKITQHKNTFHSLRYRQELVTASGETYITAATVDMPLLNQAQYQIVYRNLTGGGFGDGGTLGDITFDDGTGNLVTLPDVPTPAPFEVPEIVNNLIVPGCIARLSGPDAELGVETPPPDDPPPGWTGQLVSVATIATEIGLSLAPGGDLLDICKEYIWGAIIKGNEPNHWVGIFSLTGLALDGGYFAGVLAPLGIAGNAAAAAAKALFRRLPPEQARALVTGLGHGAIGSMRNLFRLLARAPGANTVSGMAEKVGALLTQWNRILHSPLGLGAGDATQAWRLLAENAQRHYSDEAAQGLACLARANHSAVAARVIHEYGDEVAEATFDVLRKLGGTKAAKLEAFGEDAIEGVAKLVQKADSSRSVAKSVAEKILDLDVADARKAFEKIRGFTDDEAMKGAKALVADAGNADAIKAVTSAVLDDDVIEATFKARHLQVFDDPTIAAKVGDYVQKAKTATGQIVVNGGGGAELVRAIPAPGTTCRVGVGGSETVEDMVVLLRDGSDHVVGRHVTGTERLVDADLTSFFPTGRTITFPNPPGVTSGPPSVTLPATMTDEEVIKVVMGGGGGNTGAGVTHGIDDVWVKVPSLASDPEMGHIVQAYPKYGPNVIRFNTGRTDGRGRRFEKWVNGNWVDY